MDIDAYLAWLYAHPPVAGMDCAEIAEDFARKYPGGRITTFRIGARRDIQTEEFGSRHAWSYHTVYVYGGCVYDGRFAGVALPYDNYMRHLQALNPGENIGVTDGG